MMLGWLVSALVLRVDDNDNSFGRREGERVSIAAAQVLPSWMHLERRGARSSGGARTALCISGEFRVSKKKNVRRPPGDVNTVHKPLDIAALFNAGASCDD